MQSFRSEIENPIVEKDIIDLADKIQLFHEGRIDEEKFRSLRLARGVYGQRQFGVQMIRIKLPYGKVTSEQLHRISDVSDEYSRGRLHITTRQDIQIHYVSLDRTPELWAELKRVILPCVKLVVMQYVTLQLQKRQELIKMNLLMFLHTHMLYFNSF